MTAAGSPADADGGPASRSGLSGAASVAAWGFVFLVLRIFAVSDYDWDTAFLVSAALGLDDGLALLFGSLMAGHLLTALLLTAVLPLLVAAGLWGPRSSRPVVALLVAPCLVVVVALTVSFGSWWLPAVAAVVFVAIALVRRLPAPNLLRRVATAAVVRVAWVTGLAVLVAATFTSTPWVPHEEIETTSGIVSGFVLSVDPGYLNVLTDEHEFLIIVTSDVLSRR